MNFKIWRIVVWGLWTDNKGPTHKSEFCNIKNVVALSYLNTS